MLRRTSAAVALLLVLVGCGSNANTGDKGYIDGASVIKTIEPADREPVTGISGTTLDGDKIDLTTLAAGKPMVLNVWASWCPPCRAEADKLVAAEKKLGDSATFVGINVREGSRDNGLAYERRFKVDYPSIYDPSGRLLLKLPIKVRPYAPPGTLILDSQGRVAATIFGEIPTALTLVGLVQDADK